MEKNFWFRHVLVIPELIQFLLPRNLSFNFRSNHAVILTRIIYRGAPLYIVYLTHIFNNKLTA